MIGRASRHPRRLCRFLLSNDRAVSWNRVRDRGPMIPGEYVPRFKKPPQPSRMYFCAPVPNTTSEKSSSCFAFRSIPIAFHMPVRESMLTCCNALVSLEAGILACDLGFHILLSLFTPLCVYFRPMPEASDPGRGRNGPRSSGVQPRSEVAYTGRIPNRHSPLS